MRKQINAFEIGIIAGLLIWGALVFVLELSLLNMYTSTNSALLFWCAVIIFLPAGIYLAIRVATTEQARWYKYVGYSLMASLFLIFVGYFTLIKTDLLWSLFTKPTTSGTLYLKSVEKSYLPKHGWDHTNVNTIYNGKPLQFEASRTAFFLLRHKDSLNISIGRSYTGNYFVTDIHLPGGERWAARCAYWKNWVQRYTWMAFSLIFVFIVVQVKMRYFPTIILAQIGWKRFVLLCTAVVIIIFLLIYFGLIVYLKLVKTR